MTDRERNQIDFANAIGSAASRTLQLERDLAAAQQDVYSLQQGQRNALSNLAAAQEQIASLTAEREDEVCSGCAMLLAYREQAERIKAENEELRWLLRECDTELRNWVDSGFWLIKRIRAALERNHA